MQFDFLEVLCPVVRERDLMFQDIDPLEEKIRATQLGIMARLNLLYRALSEWHATVTHPSAPA